jgi:hypothetical protein
LAAYAALWLGAAAMLFQVWRLARRAGAGGLSATVLGRPLALGLGGGLLAHFLFGIADAVAIGAKPGVLWWLLLGLVAAQYDYWRAAQPAPAAHG